MIAVTPLSAGRPTHAPAGRWCRACHVVLVDVNTVVSTVRALRGAVLVTASAVPRRRIFAILTGIVILVAVALLVPLPNALQLRDWVRGSRWHFWAHTS
jgi:hypothetical protein